MNCTLYPAARPFLDETQSFLLRHEAANGLLFGLCRRLQRLGDAAQDDVLLMAVRARGGIRLAGIMTPPHKLTLSQVDGNVRTPVSTAIDALLSARPELPGVTGPARVAAAFAEQWARAAKATVTPGRRMRIFDLASVVDPTPAPGRLRLATADDMEMLTGWILAFQEEIGEAVDRTRARAMVELKIAERDLFLWQHRRPVAMAARTRPTVNGICVNLVYTPPELRGRGYASNCVAALSRRLLGDGWKFCTLFTDLSNPVSNSIYQKIGYRPVCDFNEYHFVPPIRGGRRC